MRFCSPRREGDIYEPPDELGLKEMHGHAQNGLTCVVNIILYLFSLILDQERDFDQTQG